MGRTGPWRPQRARGPSSLRRGTSRWRAETLRLPREAAGLGPDSCEPCFRVLSDVYDVCWTSNCQRSDHSHLCGRPVRCGKSGGRSGRARARWCPQELSRAGKFRQRVLGAHHCLQGKHQNARKAFVRLSVAAGYQAPPLKCHFELLRCRAAVLIAHGTDRQLSPVQLQTALHCFVGSM